MDMLTSARDGGWIIKYLDGETWRQKRVPKEYAKKVDAELYARTFMKSVIANGAPPPLRGNCSANRENAIASLFCRASSPPRTG